MKELNVDKKLLLKVIAGVIILVIAFSMYLARNSDSEDTVQVLIPKEENHIQEGNEAEEEDVSTAAIVSEKKILIDVSGAVNQPAVVELKEGSRVFEAIELAGGLSKDADTRSTNLAQVLTDGEKLYIPTKKELEETGGSYLQTKNTSVEASGSAELININTANSETLQQLTGVGPSTAEKIIRYRTENGNFKTIEDIKNVSGIGEKTFEKFKNKITV
jgi:competence protein ComEA